MSRPQAAGFLPYARQQIDDRDIDAVTSVLRGEWLTTGPAVLRFEQALALRCGARQAVSCSSGTAALHLACLVLDLGPGDAAIVPAITFLATANAVRMTGAEPVFADVDADNGLLTAAGLEAGFARARTRGLVIKAVLPVHLAGQCPDLTSLSQLARAEGARIIEDACHAIGTYHACPNGSAAPVGACRLSEMAVFSFHPVKTIAGGEGGAVTTNDPDIARRLALLRNHGMTHDAAEFRDGDLGFDRRGTANPWYYEMVELGWNYRLSDIHAALALSQLGRLDQFVERRRGLAQRYDELLAPLGRLVQPIRRSRGCLPAWHLYSVLIDFAALDTDRAAVMAGLRAVGIGTQVHYIPLHRQPYYRQRDPGLVLEGADAYYRRTLSLPLYFGMSFADVGRVVDELQGILSRRVTKVAS
jgi:UDP-4-amino-4,6-dideoxy-N-acetyl-beta-L-altrosamine transaminase